MGHPQLIRLGWSQLALTACGIASVLCVIGIMFMPQYEELYVRHVVVPQLERQYGFRVGTLTFSRDGTTWETEGVVGIRPGSELDSLGVRNGDAPYAYHGGGWTAFASGLDAYERNRPAEFDVINANDWNAGHGRGAIRMITLVRRR